MIDAQGHQFRYDTVVTFVGYIENFKIIKDYIDSEIEKSIHSADSSALIENWPVAMEEMLFALQPQNFVLETTPPKIRKPKPGSGKIPRQHERPHYTILNPDTIRKTMGLPDPAGTGVTGAPILSTDIKRCVVKISGLNRFGWALGPTIYKSIRLRVPYTLSI